MICVTSRQKKICTPSMLNCALESQMRLWTKDLRTVLKLLKTMETFEVGVNIFCIRRWL